MSGFIPPAPSVRLIGERAHRSNLISRAFVLASRVWWLLVSMLTPAFNKTNLSTRITFAYV